MNTPIYRGTRSELQKHEKYANEWFHLQVLEAIQDMSDDKKKLITNKIEADKDGDNAFGLIKFSISSPSSSLYSSRERSDYYYLWECGLKDGSSWSGQRIVVLKSGKVNIKSLANALSNWAEKEQLDSRNKNILKANKEQYNSAGSPSHADVRGSLSNTEEGMATLWMHDYPKVRTKIVNIQSAINAMLSVREEFEQIQQDHC